MKTLLAAAAALTLAACASQRPATAPANPVAITAEVSEHYVTADSREDELDSLATWPAEDGAVWLIATAKASHRLLVFDADSGERLRSTGREGDAPGQFRRPNGVAVIGDLLLVSERDNRRVQVLSLPGLQSLATFGQDQLRAPYGLWGHETGADSVELYVTDSFMLGPRYDQLPPWRELDQRVRRYRLEHRDGDAVRATHLGHFGQTDPDTALRVVESIAGDPAQDVLLIADEDDRHLATVREYGFDGRATGRDLRTVRFEGQPEGIALWACTGSDGYWIVAEQRAPLTVFHVFDRNSLAPRGRFTGKRTSFTDGIALHAAATPRFPGGALFAVHADRAIAAFDLRDVADALELDPHCVR